MLSVSKLSSSCLRQDPVRGTVQYEDVETKTGSPYARMPYTVAPLRRPSGPMGGDGRAWIYVGRCEFSPSTSPVGGVRMCCHEGITAWRLDIHYKLVLSNSHSRDRMVGV